MPLFCKFIPQRLYKVSRTLYENGAFFFSVPQMISTQPKQERRERQRQISRVSVGLEGKSCIILAERSSDTLGTASLPQSILGNLLLSSMHVFKAILLVSVLIYVLSSGLLAAVN